MEINPGGGGGRIRMSHEYQCSFVNIVACISLCNTMRKKVYLEDLCSNSLFFFRLVRTLSHIS